MFDTYTPEIKTLLIQLHNEVTTNGKTQKAIRLRKELRRMGLLSIPFSVNSKKLGK